MLAHLHCVVWPADLYCVLRPRPIHPAIPPAHPHNPTDAAASQAKALRRRIDCVVPVGSDPFWGEQDQLAGEEAAAAEGDEVRAGALRWAGCAPDGCACSALHTLISAVLRLGQPLLLHVLLLHVPLCTLKQMRIRRPTPSLLLPVH